MQEQIGSSHLSIIHMHAVYEFKCGMNKQTKNATSIAVNFSYILEQLQQNNYVYKTHKPAK